MKKILLSTFAVAFFFAAGACVAAEKVEGYKLDAKSESLLVENCTKCHDSSKFKGRVYSVEEWDTVLKKMQINGAKFNYDDMKAVMWYKTEKK